MSNKPENSAGPATSGFDEFVEEEGIDLRHYWQVIVGHKWHILGLVFAVGLLTIIWASSLQPVYRSTATLLMGGNEAVTVSDRTDPQSQLVQGNFLATQYELLKSRKVARAVLEQLETDRALIIELIETDSVSGFDWRGWVPGSWLQPDDPVKQPIAESDPDKNILDWLREGLEVEPVRDTSIVQVSFNASEPTLAARVANAYTRAYLEFNLRQRIESTTEASQWLEQQLAKSEVHLMNSAEGLRQYREDLGLVDVAGMLDIQTALLKDRSASLIAARLARSEAESLYRRADHLQRKGQMDNIPEVLGNDRIQRLRDQETLLLREIRSDSERYQGDYPGLEDPRSELQALREQINALLRKIVEGYKTDFEIAVANELRLEKEVRALEDSLDKLGYRQVEVDALERAVETNRQAYDAFLNQLMDTRTRSADTVSMIARVLDPAVPVLRPFKPNKRLMLMMSMLLALIGGVGIVMLQDKLDNTLKSREDVQVRLGVPVLGEMTILKGKRDDGAPLVPHTHYMSEPTSSFAESVRTIRTGIVLSGLDQKHRSIVVTSSLSGEGKSTVALNLALALAQLGKVLLIDTDLHSPALARLLGVDPVAPGLTDLVAGTATTAECFRTVPGDFDVLFAGSTLPPDPPKILTSEHFTKLLEEAQASYDTVIMDSAPLELVSDARLLATRATGVVYVIKADATPQQAVRNGLNALIETGTPLLGVVLNQINPDNVHAYSKHKYGYSRFGSYSDYSYGRGPKSADSPINTRNTG